MKIKRHFYLAKLIYKTQERLRKIENSYGLNGTQRNYLFNTQKLLESIKCELDYDYHEVITDKQFIQWGHVYYNDKGLPRDIILKKNMSHKEPTKENMSVSQDNKE